MSSNSGDTTETESNELTTAAESISVAAYVRPTLMLEPMDAKLETLRTLAADGTIDELFIDAWPGKVPLEPDEGYAEALEVFDRFEYWAEQTGVSIRPPFEVSTTTSTFREETRRILRTPIMCLAISVDETLAGVFPHRDGTTEFGVTEAIAALMTDSFIDDAVPDAASAARYTACPECEGQLVDIHGIKLCHDCAWDNWNAVTGSASETTVRKLRPALTPKN